MMSFAQIIQRKKRWKQIVTDYRKRSREVEIVIWRIISRNCEGQERQDTNTRNVRVCLVWDRRAADRWGREKGKWEMWDLQVGNGKRGM